MTYGLRHTFPVVGQRMSAGSRSIHDSTQHLAWEQVHGYNGRLLMTVLLLAAQNCTHVCECRIQREIQIVTVDLNCCDTHVLCRTKCCT